MRFDGVIQAAGQTASGRREDGEGEEKRARDMGNDTVIRSKRAGEFRAEFRGHPYLIKFFW